MQSRIARRQLMENVTRMAMTAITPSEIVMVMEELNVATSVCASSMTRFATFPALFAWKNLRESVRSRWYISLRRSPVKRTAAKMHRVAWNAPRKCCTIGAST